MGRIRLLPDIVASQVAAGEVVERPASAVKELVENSLDAGAKKIEVEFARGGTWLIRVTDDGDGMERDDALLSLERHATSKISGGGDLARISTFGFRGEAIPSIASVSRFRLATRPGGSASGTEILVEGGKIVDVRDCGIPAGTSIEVRSLFFNLPARKKFLRGEQTEAAHVQQQFYNAALAHPEIAFLLTRDGKIIHQLGATDDLRVRARDLFGEEWLSRVALAPSIEREGIRVSGLLSRPAFARADRTRQFIFLNRRAIGDAAISRGLREAFAGLDGHRVNPIGALFLEMDPLAFDCNVHPAKREVRFHRPDLVRDAVFEFARSALRASTPGTAINAASARGTNAVSDNDRPSQGGRAELLNPERTATIGAHPETALPRALSPQEVASTPEFPSAAISPAPISAPISSPADIARHQPTTSPNPDDAPPSPGEGFVFRGPLGDRYWLLENAEGLVLLDVRHAAERIYYEEISRARAREGIAGQRLLVPETIRVLPQDYAWILENPTVLRAAGMWAEAFGGNAIKIEAVPSGMDEWTPGELLLRLLDEVRAGTRSSARRFLHDQVALAISRLRAAGFRAPPPDIEDPSQFIDKLFACDLPYATPSGRPTILQISWSELHRKFS